MNEFFANPVTQYVLLAVLLLVAVQLARLLEAKRKEADVSGRETKYDSLYWVLDRSAESAVYAVEQLWKSGQVAKEKRRDEAVRFIQNYLTSHGYPDVPVNEIIYAVEKAVYTLFNKDKQTP